MPRTEKGELLSVRDRLVGFLSQLPWTPIDPLGTLKAASDLTYLSDGVSCLVEGILKCCLGSKRVRGISPREIFTGAYPCITRERDQILDMATQMPEMMAAIDAYYAGADDIDMGYDLSQGPNETHQIARKEHKELFEVPEHLNNIFPPEIIPLLIQVGGRADSVAVHLRQHTTEWMSSVGLQRPNLKTRIEQRREFKISRAMRLSKWFGNLTIMAYMLLYGDQPQGWENFDTAVEWLNNVASGVWDAPARWMHSFASWFPVRSFKEIDFSSKEEIVWMFLGMMSCIKGLRDKSSGSFWRVDQIQNDNQWKRDRVERLKAGTRIYGALTDVLDGEEAKVGQTVVFGIGDPIMTAKGDRWQGSYLRALREASPAPTGQEMGDVVGVQNAGPKRTHDAVGVDCNDDGDMYVNLKALRNAATKRVEWFQAILAMGLHKAGRVQFNLQRNYDHFDTRVADTETGRALSWDINTIYHLLENTVILRRMFWSEIGDLEVHVIMPKFVRAHDNDEELLEGQDPCDEFYAHWFQRLEKLGGIKIHPVIKPEDLMMKDLDREIRRKEIYKPKVYIHLDGQDNGEGKRKNAKTTIRQYFEEKVAVVGTPGEANVCLWLREHMAGVDPSSSAFLERYSNIQLLLYPSTSRNDVVMHDQVTPGKQKRRPSPKSGEAAAILDQINEAN